MKDLNSETAVKLVIESSLKRIIERYPVCKDFFSNLRLFDINLDLPLMQALDAINDDIISEFGLDKAAIFREFCLFLETFSQENDLISEIKSITILGGHGKSGEPETSKFTVSIGEIISIVGPTGSGKSRLLADIECLADRDTPSGRKILIDNKEIDENERLQQQGKIVAQLSQNMNFVMDLTVREFLEMHAASRLSKNPKAVVDLCFECASKLAGEPFTLDVKVTQLSGGQSRALMIADTAYMSRSPIVLIDEIENAGIDRRQAIQLLAKNEKIVFIATHDPLLALGADKRIVIKNGAVTDILKTSATEKECLNYLEKLDSFLSKLRKDIRAGLNIDANIMKGIL